MEAEVKGLQPVDDEEMIENTDETGTAEESKGSTEEAANESADQGEGSNEEPEKVYTEAEFNEKLDSILSRKIARERRKVEREYREKYGDLEEVLKAGTGKDDLKEITGTFRNFYNSKGIQVPQQAKYSAYDTEILARAEANDIIASGFSDVVEETDRLASIGTDRMSDREKQVFKTLAEYRQQAEREQELAKIGVSKDVYESTEFKTFAAKFNAKTPLKDVYAMYEKLQPKKEVRPMGSMKTNTQDDKGVKEFYTRDEALKFTKKDFDNNPALYKAVEKSMAKW